MLSEAHKKCVQAVPDEDTVFLVTVMDASRSSTVSSVQVGEAKNRNE